MCTRLTLKEIHSEKNVEENRREANGTDEPVLYVDTTDV